MSKKPLQNKYQRVHGFFTKDRKLFKVPVLLVITGKPQTLERNIIYITICLLISSIKYLLDLKRVAPSIPTYGSLKFTGALIHEK